MRRDKHWGVPAAPLQTDAPHRAQLGVVRPTRMGDEGIVAAPHEKEGSSGA